MPKGILLDVERPDYTLQLLDELEGRFGMTDPLLKRLHHLPETTSINGHRSYCNRQIKNGARFQSPGNPETAARLEACLAALRAGAAWEHAIEHAVKKIPVPFGENESVEPLMGETGNARPQLRAFLWSEFKRLERAKLGKAAKVSPQRDKYVISKGHPAAMRLTSTPDAKGGFIRADTGSLLFRNATREFVDSVPGGLLRKRMDSRKGLEFRWTQLSEAEIRTMVDLILKCAAPIHFEPIADHAELATAVGKLVSLPLAGGIPTGQLRPERVATSRDEFRRCPHVFAWVLCASEGKCERCRRPAPFQRVDGTPFLEVHHVRRLAEGGSDRVTNAVALCPNCHRFLHHSPDAPAAVEGLYLSVSRLVREEE